MKGARILREIVAELAQVRADEIDAGFPVQDLPSIKKAALVAAIRRDLGVDCMRAAFAKTYADLEAVVAQRRK